MHLLFIEIDLYSYIQQRISAHTCRAVLSDPFKPLLCILGSLFEESVADLAPTPTYET